eukprot:TRINITY_DN4261_c0_g2_i1.p1 TRINITY_DN4261_c0_g2~~TRINITY_DN4261_c0_g2_i1.p1  ORF type:complete len:321 (-),score=115.27 TRINITY_DN4261_c0_g2_i1:37-999(-)
MQSASLSLQRQYQPELRSSAVQADPERACRLLEERAAELRCRLSETSRQQELKAARQQAASARAWREQAAAEYPPAQRARKLAQSKLGPSQTELRAVLERCERQEKDNEGLRRTLQRLQEQLTHARAEVSKCKEEAAKAEQDEATLWHEDEVLQQSVDTMADVRKCLEERREEERQKRLELKAAFRAKIQSVEEEQTKLKQRCQEQAAEFEAWQVRVAEQQEQTNAAVAELESCRAAADEAGREAQQVLLAKQHTHAEFMQVQKAHRQLNDSLKEARQRLQRRLKEDAEVQSLWRLEHLNQVDARAQARRSLDREILIAT